MSSWRGPGLADHGRGLIIGCGGMGSLLALFLYRSQQKPPYCVFRRRVGEGLPEHVQVSFPDGGSILVPIEALNGIEEASIVIEDAWPLLVAVKAYDLSMVFSSLKELKLHSPLGVLVNGLTMPLHALNYGINAYLILSDYGVTRITVGKVELKGEGTLVIGYPSPFDSIGVDGGEPCRVAMLFRRGGGNAYCSFLMDRYMWLKAAVNAGINGPSAILGVENGFLLGNEWSYSLLRGLASLVARAAQLSGVSLSVDEAVSYTVEVASRTWRNRSSMLQDLEACRKTEVSDIYEPAIRVLKEHGIDAGMLEAVYLLIRAIEEGRLRCRERR